MRRPCEVIADLVSDAVLVVDDAGTILLANRPSELLLGGSGRQHVAHLAGEIGLFAPAQLLQLGDRSGPPSLGEVASLREEQERIVGAHVTRQS